MVSVSGGDMNNLKSCFILIISFLILFSVIFFGCKKKEEPSGQEAVSQSSPSYESGKEEYSINDIKLENIKNTKLSFTAPAHSKYLNDPLEFYELPDGGIPKGNTAVVGSDVCRFYPVESVSSPADLAKLPAGELIPFTTIISLGDEIRDLKSYNNREELFSFQGNFNYFYKTVWNGIKGIVFGADLYGIEAPNEDNRLNSMLYKYNGALENFYPNTGYKQITPGIIEDLENIGISFQKINGNEIHLTHEYPDDMISEYQYLGRNSHYYSKKSIFVTTDLAAHANHLIFNRLMQHIEENYFFPRLILLTDEYIKAIESRKNQTPQNVYNASLVYFQMAKALLALAPQKIIGNDRGNTVEYREVNIADVLKTFPAQIKNEIEKMNEAQGLGESAVFPFLDEDYSQYKARGYYTKNGVLSAYFRALTWYGRIHFVLGGEGNTKEFAQQMAPVALFITDVTESSPELKKLWSSLFDPITELIGISDDISFIELAPLWNQIKGEGFNKWYNDSANRAKFITSDYSQLRRPSISGFSLINGGAYDGGESIPDRLPPIGWRLFGQRYTLDNEIHYNVSPPRYSCPPSPRHMVRGLDIMKVFGSAAADMLLKYSDYHLHPGLEDILNSMQKDIENKTKDYWTSNYYSNNLYQIKTLATFETGTGFYFTERPGWNLKSMNSAHGTWAELRHDTMLYVKDNVGEGGGGRGGATFRTKPLPKPVHYLEPNVPFWDTCVTAFIKLNDVLIKYNYIDKKTSELFLGMIELYKKAAQIARIETEDNEVTRNDIEWIARIANELAIRVMTHAPGRVDDIDTLRMALIADVYTNAEIEEVLEAAVGIPYRLFIPLNDRQGGKRIAVGFGFSYYEFHKPISQRLNNDEWKKIVYADNPDMSEYLPFWMQGRVLPPESK